MTDYSKLSDAEIAERVCRKLGAPPVISDGYPDINRWIKNIIPIFNQSWVMGFGVPCTYEESVLRKYTYICFDWPAPIMMQKVKEWFEKADLEVTASYGPVERLWSYLIEKPSPECSCVAISRGKDPRALYEAFLQVEAAHG